MLLEGVTDERMIRLIKVLNRSSSISNSIRANDDKDKVVVIKLLFL